MAVLLARGQITIAAIKDGKDGVQGKPGKDGITWTLTPDILTYDTDDSGKAINVGTGKATTLRVMRGNEELTNFTIKGVKNMVNCVASRLNNTSSFYISAITVQKVTLGTDTMDVSCTNGSFDVEFAVDGVTYTATAKFAVNVSAFTGRMTLNNKQYESKFEALENDLKGSSPTVLNAYTSTIKQTAKEITLSVTQSQQGRHNLLRDTALTRKGDIYYSDGLFQPTITQGVNGHNAIRFSVTGDGTPQYKGLFWGQHSVNGIAVKKNTDYTFSAWIKCDTKDLQVRSEVYKMAALNGNRGDRITATSGKMEWLTKENEVNQWRQVNYTFNTGNAEFIEVNIFVYNGITVDGTFGYTASGNGWICMPMLEEGSEYTGWTPAETDYDYLGGNMLDDTRTLVASGQLSNLYTANEVAQDTYEGAYAVVHGKADSSNNNVCDFLRFKGENGRILNFELRKNYVFSFLAKGSGTLKTHLYKDSVHVNIYAENSQGSVRENVADGASNFTLTSEWKRYWVHWRIDPYTGNGDTVLPQSVMLRAVDGCEAWVAKPKLEEGALMTEYTEKKTDLIDRATAKAAGLEITSSGVTLYGEKIKVENTLSTGQTTTAALFTDGAINAALILAQMLTSQGHNGQMVRIADGLINIYGKAGTANIRFGLNSSGQAVLSYYDDNGNFLYDLGPTGIASLSKTDAKITSAQYIKAEDAGLTTPLGENVDLPWVETTKSWYTATMDNNYILFVKGATGKTTTLYRYSAPRVNGKIVADSANGLGTYDLASAADGRTFTSRIMVKNGALTNLADGVFLTRDATVYDNTKLVPSIKKGQSVTRPSFYVQIATFSAKNMTLAGHGRIYSIQTETTFGNLDVGIMSNNNY